MGSSHEDANFRVVRINCRKSKEKLKIYMSWLGSQRKLWVKFPIASLFDINKNKSKNSIECKRRHFL